MQKKSIYFGDLTNLDYYVVSFCEFGLMPCFRTWRQVSGSE